MKLADFFAELKRRNAYKVAAAYAVVGWLLIQIATQVFPFFEIPNWAVRVVVLAIVLGFPIAMIIAWAFEITPEGIKRTEAADAARESSRGAAWIYVVVIGAAISIALFFLGRYSARSFEEAPAKSIAVLPFDNLSRDPDNAYFAEGVQDEILTRLAKMSDLKVISRTSTQRFKSAPEDLRAIAKQLGVMHILEGSVQKSNDQVRVNVQLINAASDAHLWAEIYDRKLTDIFAVESEIAKTIAETLRAKLSGAEMRAMTAEPTKDAAAHELYLRGRFFLSKRTADDIRTALNYMEQATQSDASFALAYAGIAECHALLPLYSGAKPLDECPKGIEAAHKALALDATLAEAHASLGLLQSIFEYDFTASIQAFEQAIKLNPNYATAHHWLANATLPCVGQSARAIEEMKRARELDPLSLIINADLGVAYGYAERYDEAIAQLKKTLELDPRFYYAHWNLAQNYEWRGDLAAAIAEYEKAVALDDDPYPLGLLAQARAKAGQHDEARKILHQLEATESTHFVPRYSFALIYLALGEKERALDFLERSYEQREADVNTIRYDLNLRSLKGDPRFESLVRKILRQ